MTSFDDSVERLRSAAGHVAAAASAVANAVGYITGPITGPWERFTRWLKSVMPKGLYARSLLIIIVPMVVLQSVVALMFMDRHWDLVTHYLSSAVTQEIATLIDVYKTYPQSADHAQLRRIAQDRLGLVVDFLPGTELPPPGPKPFFSQLDETLSDEIRKQIGLPFWIDTVGRSSIVEIRIKLDDTIMRVFARRADAYDFEFLDIPAVDGRDLPCGARDCDRISAQSNSPDRAARRCRGSLRQGPRSAKFPSPRRPRSPACLGRISRNEGPH